MEFLLGLALGVLSVLTIGALVTGPLVVIGVGFGRRYRRH